MRSLILINALAFLWAAWRRRYLIVIPILLMPIIGGLVGTLSTKKYETNTTILIQEAAKQNPFLKDLTVETNLRERMAALQALLHSRHILADVAQRMKLVTKDMPPEQASEVIATLSKSLSASLVGDDLVRITYVSNDPTDMAEILRLVSIRFVERIIAPQRSSIVSSENFLKKELSERKADLEAAERKLAEYKSKFASELPELHTSNVMRLGRLRETLAARRTELEGARASWQDLKDRLFKTNPVIGRIEERIVEVMSELTLLRSRYTDNHTMVQGALRKLKSLREERGKTLNATKKLKDGDLERLWNLASNQTTDPAGTQQTLLISQLERLQEGEVRVSNLEKQVENLDGELVKLQSKVTGFGVHEQRLAELSREAKVKRKIYQDLAERHQLARVTGSLGKAEEKERVKLIDPAFTPIAPTNLPIILFVVLGLIGGIVLGSALAVITEILDLTIRTRRQMEKLCDIKVLTRIPRLSDDSLVPDSGSTPLVLCGETGVLVPAE